MNVNAITDKILEDAREQASRVLMEAQERAQQARARSDEKITRQRDLAMAEARRECVEVRDRMLRMAELDQKKELLAMKREMIDAAFEDAYARMLAMSPQEAQSYLTELMLSACQGDEQVIVGQSEQLIDQAFLEQVNQRLKRQGKQGALKLAEERRGFRGGFVLRRQGLEMNCTYAAVLKEARPALEAEVAATLFP